MADSLWEKPNIWRRGGRFFVPQHLPKQRLGDVVALLSNVFINHAYVNDGGIEYAGYSPLFDLTDSVGTVNMYHIEVAEGKLKFVRDV